MTTPLSQAILLDELTARKGRDARYSIRSFARDLGISKTALSDVLAGKRRFSKKSALEVSERLVLQPESKRAFLGEHILGYGGYGGNAAEAAPAPLSEDRFRADSDLRSSALMALARMKTNRADPKWVSRRLEVSELEAKDSINRLLRLGAIEVRSKRLVLKAESRLREAHPDAQAAGRRRSKQALSLAEAALERDPGVGRFFQNAAIPVSRKRLAEAERMITDFRKRFSEILGAPEPKNDDSSEVCVLSIQFFPLRGDQK